MRTTTGLEGQRLWGAIFEESSVGLDHSQCSNAGTGRKEDAEARVDRKVITKVADGLKDH